MGPPDERTRFYVHSLAAGPEGSIRLLQPKRIDIEPATAASGALREVRRGGAAEEICDPSGRGTMAAKRQRGDGDRYADEGPVQAPEIGPEEDGEQHDHGRDRQGRGMAERGQVRAQQAGDDLRKIVGFSAADEIEKLDRLKSAGRFPNPNTLG